MGLEEELSWSTSRPASEGNGGQEAIILVVDTSFLKDLSNRHLWAYDLILRMEHIAKEQGKKWEWRAPLGVIRQYNNFLEHGILEEDTGIPFAHHSIDDLLDISKNMEFLFADYTLDLANQIWMDGPEGRRQAKRSNSRKAGEADISVIQFALGIAQGGADVYVASSDFKDLIRPLENQGELFLESGWRITPLAPSEIDLKYWKQNNLEHSIMYTLTGKAISELQKLKSSSSSYPLVIFEKEVESGNNVFNAGVGVVEKVRFRPFELPQEYGSISEKYSLVPALKVKSLKDEKSTREIVRVSRELNTLKLVVVEDDQPYFPTLVGVVRGRVNATSHLYRANPDFLYWQANSIFAKETYKPVFMRN